MWTVQLPYDIFGTRGRKRCKVTSGLQAKQLVSGRKSANYRPWGGWGQWGGLAALTTWAPHGHQGDPLTSRAPSNCLACRSSSAAPAQGEDWHALDKPTKKRKVDEVSRLVCAGHRSSLEFKERGRVVPMSTAV